MDSANLTLLTRGEHIFEAVEEGQSAFIIISGEVDVYKSTRGRRTLAGRLGPQELIGEICLCSDDAVRSATVVAFTDKVQLLEVVKADFEGSWSKAPCGCGW